MRDIINDFLFDIAGLFLPGFVFLALFAASVMTFFNYDFIEGLARAAENYKMPIVYALQVSIFEKNFAFKFWTVVFVIIFVSYMLGHVLKVLSKVYYDLMVVIFDKGITPVLDRQRPRPTSSAQVVPAIPQPPSLQVQVSSWQLCVIWFCKFFHGVVAVIASNFRTIFVFDAKSYNSKNHPLIPQVVGEINGKFQANFPTEWYSIYKLSQVVLENNQIKTLSHKFLARYNFYRSLALVFMIHGLMVVVLRVIDATDMNRFFLDKWPWILLMDGILWVTFHDKYKRYFELCGNESLIGMFYYLKRP